MQRDGDSLLYRVTVHLLYRPLWSLDTSTCITVHLLYRPLCGDLIRPLVSLSTCCIVHSVESGYVHLCHCPLAVSSTLWSLDTSTPLAVSSTLESGYVHLYHCPLAVSSTLWSLVTATCVTVHLVYRPLCGIYWFGCVLVIVVGITENVNNGRRSNVFSFYLKMTVYMTYYSGADR